MYYISKFNRENSRCPPSSLFSLSGKNSDHVVNNVDELQENPGRRAMVNVHLYGSGPGRRLHSNQKGCAFKNTFGLLKKNASKSRATKLHVNEFDAVIEIYNPCWEPGPTLLCQEFENTEKTCDVRSPLGRLPKPTFVNFRYGRGGLLCISELLFAVFVYPLSSTSSKNEQLLNSKDFRRTYAFNVY